MEKLIEWSFYKNCSVFVRISYLKCIDNSIRNLSLYDIYCPRSFQVTNFVQRKIIDISMGKQFYVQLNCVITLQLNSGNGIFTQN